MFGYPAQHRYSIIKSKKHKKTDLESGFETTAAKTSPPPHDGEIVEEVGEYEQCGHEAKVYEGWFAALVSLKRKPKFQTVTN